VAPGSDSKSEYNYFIKERVNLDQMGPYLGINVFLQEKVLSFSKKWTLLSKMGVSLKNDFRFLNGPRNVRDP